MNTVAKIFLISLTIVAGAQAEDEKKLKPEIAQHDKDRAQKDSWSNRFFSDPLLIKQQASRIAKPFWLKKVQSRYAKAALENAFKEAQKTEMFGRLDRATWNCLTEGPESNECVQFRQLEAKFLQTNAGKKLKKAKEQYLLPYLKYHGSKRIIWNLKNQLNDSTETAIKDAIHRTLHGYRYCSIGHTAEIYEKAKNKLNKMADNVLYEK